MLKIREHNNHFAEVAGEVVSSDNIWAEILLKEDFHSSNAMYLKGETLKVRKRDIIQVIQ